MKDLKFKLSDDPNDMMEHDGHKLYRIIALKTFSHPEGTYVVHEDDKGGFVEHEGNLSQNDASWIFDNAKVLEAACVRHDAVVRDSAVVRGKAILGGCAVVSNRALVDGNAYLTSHCSLYNAAHVTGNTIINSPQACIYGNAVINGNVKITATVTVFDDARIEGPKGNDNDMLFISRDGDFGPGSVIRSEFDYFSATNQWSSNRRITYVRNSGLWVTGCFRGTSDELIAKAYKDSFVKGECFRKLVRYVEDICDIREKAGFNPSNPWQVVKHLWYTMKGKKKGKKEEAENLLSWL